MKCVNYEIRLVEVFYASKSVH